MNTAPISTTSTYPDTHKAPASIHALNACNARTLVKGLDERLRGRLEARGMTNYFTHAEITDLQITAAGYKGYRLHLSFAPFLTPVKGGNAITSLEVRNWFAQDPSGGILQQLWDTIIEAGGEFLAIESSLENGALLLYGRFGDVHPGRADNRRFTLGVFFTTQSVNTRW